MLKTNLKFVSLLFCLMFSVAAVHAQGRETYTGTILSYGNGPNARTITGTFTLTLDRLTSDQRAQQLLGLLEENEQSRLQSELDKETVGTFSVDGHVGINVNVARETTIDGKRRVFAVFNRWMSFGEVRGGYRSTDYPYGVIEIYVDPATGKGDGTFVAAAQIRWRREKSNSQFQVEIENFATYPARLMGVVEHRDRASLR